MQRADNTLTDAEFWQLIGHIDAHGYEGASRKLKVTVAVLVLAIFEVCEPENLERVRGALAMHPVRK